jgi:hypothetical protein
MQAEPACHAPNHSMGMTVTIWQGVSRPPRGRHVRARGCTSSCSGRGSARRSCRDIGRLCVVGWAAAGASGRLGIPVESAQGSGSSRHSECSRQTLPVRGTSYRLIDKSLVARCCNGRATGYRRDSSIWAARGGLSRRRGTPASGNGSHAAVCPAFPTLLACHDGVKRWPAGRRHEPASVGLIEVLGIDDVEQFLAVDQPAQVRREQLDDAPIFVGAQRGSVRCDDDLRHLPQRRVDG